QGMKILIADDDAIARRLTAAAVERLGHQVLTVSDGLAAWSALAGDDRPQLAILDWNMPGLRGPAICRRPPAARQRAHVSVLLPTARSSGGDVVAGLDAGADDLLVKPIDPDELAARLRVGQRLLELESELRSARSYLEAVLARIDSGVLLTDA